MPASSTWQKVSIDTACSVVGGCIFKNNFVVMAKCKQGQTVQASSWQGGSQFLTASYNFTLKGRDFEPLIYSLIKESSLKSK